MLSHIAVCVLEAEYIMCYVHSRHCVMCIVDSWCVRFNVCALGFCMIRSSNLLHACMPINMQGSIRREVPGN